MTGAKWLPRASNKDAGGDGAPLAGVLATVALVEVARLVIPVPARLSLTGSVFACGKDAGGDGTPLAGVPSTGGLVAVAGVVFPVPARLSLTRNIFASDRGCGFWHHDDVDTRRAMNRLAPEK